MPFIEIRGTVQNEKKETVDVIACIDAEEAIEKVATDNGIKGVEGNIMRHYFASVESIEIKGF